VDLPAPFGPSSPVMRPSPAVKSTPSSARTSPNRFASETTSIIDEASGSGAGGGQEERRRRLGRETPGVDIGRRAFEKVRDHARSTAYSGDAVTLIGHDDVLRVGQPRGDHLVRVARRRDRVELAG